LKIGQLGVVGAEVDAVGVGETVAREVEDRRVALLHSLAHQVVADLTQHADPRGLLASEQLDARRNRRAA
jgi:hypothetical protein